MAAFKIILLLFVVIRPFQCLDFQEPLLQFGVIGGEVTFQVMFTYRFSNYDFTALLYRSSEDGPPLLLMESTFDPSTQPSSDQVSRVSYWAGNFKLTNLSLLDSGLYHTERNRRGVRRDLRHHHLDICEESLEFNQTDKKYRQLVEFDLAENETLLVFDEEHVQAYLDDPGTKKLVADTSVKGSETGRVRISKRDSKMKVSVPKDSRSKAFYFLIWHNKKCRALGAIHFVFPLTPGPTSFGNLFFKTSEQITLTCDPIVKYIEAYSWKTPMGEFYVDRAVSTNLSYETVEGIHVIPQNDSLLILSVSPEHSGSYECIHQDIHVYVCLDKQTLYETFTEGENVVLDCSVHMKQEGVQAAWFYHREGGAAGGQGESVDKEGIGEYIQRDDMREQDASSDDQSPLRLLLSNLSLNDSGQYTCRVWGHKENGSVFCWDRKIHMTRRWWFGVNSVFYRAYCTLMAGMLLGMIGAVVWVSRKSRWEEQEVSCSVTLGRRTERGQGEDEHT